MSDVAPQVAQDEGGQRRVCVTLVETRLNGSDDRLDGVVESGEASGRLFRFEQMTGIEPARRTTDSHEGDQRPASTPAAAPFLGIGGWGASDDQAGISSRR